MSYDPDTLRAVCFRRLQLRGSVLLQAPADHVKQALDKLAEINKGLPALPTGQAYSCKHVMVSGDAVRMEQHRESLTREGIVDFDWNVDVKQTTRFATKMQVIPTVLRAATIYNLAARRLFLLSELMSCKDSRGTCKPTTQHRPACLTLISLQALMPCLRRISDQ